MRISVTSLAVLLASLCILPAAGQERDRSQVPDQYKWNLADLYPNDAAWRAAKEKIAADITPLAQFRGKLGSSPAALADALDRAYAVKGVVAAPTSTPACSPTRTRATPATRACSRK